MSHANFSHDTFLLDDCTYSFAPRCSDNLCVAVSFSQKNSTSESYTIQCGTSTVTDMAVKRQGWCRVHQRKFAAYVSRMRWNGMIKIEPSFLTTCLDYAASVLLTRSCTPDGVCDSGWDRVPSSRLQPSNSCLSRCSSREVSPMSRILFHDTFHIGLTHRSPSTDGQRQHIHGNVAIWMKFHTLTLHIHACPSTCLVDWIIHHLAHLVVLSSSRSCGRCRLLHLPCGRCGFRSLLFCAASTVFWWCCLPLPLRVAVATAAVGIGNKWPCRLRSPISPCSHSSFLCF